MLRRSACAISALFALSLIAAGPAAAQEAPKAAAEPPAAAQQPAAPPASATPAAEKPPEPAKPVAASEQPPAPSTPPAATDQPPAPTPVVAEPPPPPPVDPLVAEVRRLLGEPAKGNVDRGDRGALAAFYGASTGPPLWVTNDGFTAKARHAMAEVRKADDWGLSAAAFELPNLAQGENAPAVLAAAEIKLGLAVLKYARHARGGRLDPAQLSRHLDQKPTLRDPKVVLEAMAGTETPGDYLRDLNPKHVQFQKLRQALLKVRGGGHVSKPAEPARAPADLRLPDGPSLKLGNQHPHVVILRQRLGLPMPRGAESIYDLQVQDAVKVFQSQNNIMTTGMLTPRTRAALNAGARQEGPVAAAPAPVGSEVQRIVANMERWRWMPEHLGELNVQDNIPEFMTRVVKKGQVIHSARIVVGKPDTPTAVFSANMRYIVFHPEWGVPDSIKLKEIAPYLRSGGSGFFGFGGGDTSILERQRLRVVYNGRSVDASSVNWGSVDIRRFTFIQSAGPHNVLGVVKFRFPNKHDIYMHDTPQRELLDKPVRLFSHGCMRVQNPGRLAELILAEDKGWTAEHVRGLLATGYNNEVTLSREIPVHVTYFTAVVGEDGHVSYFSDPYGHDARVLAALAGRPLPPDIGPGSAGSDDDAVREARRPQRQKQQSANDFFSGLFGN